MRILLIGLIYLFFSCSPKKSQQLENNDGELSQNDPRVKRAFVLAQDSLLFFIETFNKSQGQVAYNFFIKTKLDNSNGFERVWARPFSVLNNTFNCTLDSNPKSLTGYKFGDTIQVNFDTVEDFMIILGDSVIGNYLQRELNKDLKKSPIQH